MSSFKLGFPTIQPEATLTASHTASTTRPSTNLFSGARSDRFELASTTSDCITLNYDLGVSTATSNFLAIMRAKLLAASGCSGVRLRGSTVSGVTLPVAPTAHWDANRGVTVTATNTISQINDQSGNGHHATQGTEANRPLLTGASNDENRLTSSESLSGTGYTVANMTSPSDGIKLETAVTNLHYTLFSNSVPSGVSVRLSGEFKSIGGRNVQFGIFSDSRTLVLNLATGSVLTESLTANSWTYAITALPDSWYRITIEGVSSGAIRGWIAYAADGTNVSYAGDITKGYEYRNCFAQAATASPTYIPTTTYPIIAGLNGNRGMLFDGSNDFLNTSIAVNPTGGMWGWAVVRANTVHTSVLFGAYDGTIQNRLWGTITSAGAIALRVWRDATAYIQRASNSSAYTANSAFIFFWTYDGTTSATGIKLYKNLTQIDTTTASAGVYAVPTASTLGLKLGALNGTSDFLNGTLYSTGFAQGGTISDADRVALTTYLIDKYITSPIASVDFPVTYNGGQADDYLTTFAESAAFRHYWLQFNTETTSKFKVAKAFFGKALDLGREPVYPLNISKSKDNPWSRAAAFTADLNFEAVTDSKKSELIELIKKPELALAALDSEDVLFRGALGIDCSITENDIEPFYTTENDLSIILKENI